MSFAYSRVASVGDMQSITNKEKGWFLIGWLMDSTILHPQNTVQIIPLSANAKALFRCAVEPVCEAIALLIIGSGVVFLIFKEKICGRRLLILQRKE